MFSEHLVALGDGVFATTDPSVKPGTNQGKRGIFQISTAMVLDQGSAVNAQAFVTACQSLPSNTVATTDDAFGSQWLLSTDYATANNAYLHFMPPNSISCVGAGSFGVSDTGWGGVGGAISATSNHSGGVNVGMADGSVKFIKNTVALQTWWALGTRAGGEVVSADAY
jgi:prepilin-type processing-associated H-X9-DG protein